MICRACKAGDCPDCIRWLWRSDGCHHECGAMVQLPLFPLDGGVFPRTSQRPSSPSQGETVDW